MAVQEDRQNNSHARVITQLIDGVMKAVGVEYQQLDAIAVSSGPGSFTGLRIGASVAKGLCYSLDKLLISVPTLQALAVGIRKNIPDTSALYMAVLDARRTDIYSAAFNYDGAEVVKAVKVNAAKHLEKMIVTHPNMIIGGSQIAVDKCRKALEGHVARFVEGLENDARNMTSIADYRFEKKIFENLAYFQPEYLEEFGVK